MTIKRNSLREQIRDALLQRIGTGQIQPGQRIVEAQLIKEFNVSSIPIREAIRELVAMGMLDCASHRGAWVRKVDMPETIEALQVRTALEKAVT